MQQMFECHQCGVHPKQFTILICSHLICEQCWEEHSSQIHGVSYYKCKCGQTTCETLNNCSPRKQLENITAHSFRNSRNVSRHAGKLTRQSSPRQKDKSVRMMTLNGSTFDEHSYPQANHRNKTEMSAFDESTIMQKNNYAIGIGNNNEPSKENTTEYISNLMRSTIQAHQKQDQELSKELTSELKFLQLQFTREMDSITKNFTKLTHNLMNQYQRLVKKIKVYCFQQIVDSSHTPFNLPQLVQSKYDQVIGSKLSTIAQCLLTLKFDVKKGHNYNDIVEYRPERKQRPSDTMNVNRGRGLSGDREVMSIYMSPPQCQHFFPRKSKNQTIPQRDRKRLTKKSKNYVAERVRF